MAEKELVAIECPRGNQAHKEVWIDRDDPRHTRECASCQYTWEYREGMPTYPGETFVETPAVPAPELVETPATPAETPAETPEV